MTLEFILDIERWGGGEPTAVGEGHKFIYKGKFYSILFTRAGMFRGNHIHPVEQHTLLLRGKGKYVFKINGENEDQHLKEGKILDIPEGIPHIFLPKDDCLTVEWWEGDFIAEEYDFPEFTKEINKRISEFERKVEEMKK
jgi:oxalate decarboxylase/phosphoglucose isomerase-like protein (cupin superfamily)